MATVPCVNLPHFSIGQKINQNNPPIAMVSYFLVDVNYMIVLKGHGSIVMFVLFLLLHLVLGYTVADTGTASIQLTSLLS
jgi:hypothetical protein